MAVAAASRSCTGRFVGAARYHAGPAGLWPQGASGPQAAARVSAHLHVGCRRERDGGRRPGAARSERRQARARPAQPNGAVPLPPSLEPLGNSDRLPVGAAQFRAGDGFELGRICGSRGLRCGSERRRRWASNPPLRNLRQLSASAWAIGRCRSGLGSGTSGSKPSRRARKSSALVQVVRSKAGWSRQGCSTEGMNSTGVPIARQGNAQCSPYW